MAMGTTELTITDLYCGVGGSSTGAVMVPGVRLMMAANHWPLAVRVHSANHPNSEHDCADISQVDPRRYPRTDLLWISPECTNHSIAKGKRSHDPAAERSRATMWDVIRFAEHHQYAGIIVENVVDVLKWVYFPAWRAAMEVNYELTIVYMNSMHAWAGGPAAAQDRNRVYVLATRRGARRPDVAKWTSPPAWCEPCGSEVRAVQSWKKKDVEPWGKYRAQYVYRCPLCSSQVEPAYLPATTIIDWSDPGQLIGERKRPLAWKTWARIMHGVVDHADEWLSVPAGGTWNDSARPMSLPLRTRTTRETDGVLFPPGLLVPVEGRSGKRAFDARRPMRTMTTRNETGLLVPPSLMVELKGKPAKGKSRSVHSALSTVAASGNHHMLVSYYGKRGLSPVTDALGTVTTRDRHGLVGVPPFEGDSFMEYLRSSHRRMSRALERFVESCHFRMLSPEEIRAAMALPDDYLLEGTKRERVKLLGNGVTPPAARDLMYAMREAITGRSNVVADVWEERAAA